MDWDKAKREITQEAFPAQALHNIHASHLIASSIMKWLTRPSKRQRKKEENLKNLGCPDTQDLQENVGPFPCSERKQWLPLSFFLLSPKESSDFFSHSFSYLWDIPIRNWWAQQNLISSSNGHNINRTKKWQGMNQYISCSNNQEIMLKRKGAVLPLQSATSK